MTGPPRLDHEIDVVESELELTSYAELVLTRGHRAANPAFSSLRPEESLPRLEAPSRPVGPIARGPYVCAAHVVVVEGESGGGDQFGTDARDSRARTSIAPRCR